MSGLGRALTISRVELLRFFRDRGNYFFVLVLPLALVIFIGLQFGGGMATGLGVVAADADDPQVAELIAELEDLEGLTVVAVDDEDELETLVGRASVSGGLVLPEGFGRALRTAEPVEVGLVVRPDPGARALRPLVDSALAEVSAAADAARAASSALDRPAEELVDLAGQVRSQVPQVTVTDVPVGGDELQAEFDSLGQFDLGASSQLFLFVFLTSLAGSAGLIQTRQYGVATRMLSTPTRLPILLLGLGGGRFAIALFQALYIILVTAVAFGVDWGSPLATTLLVLVFCLVSAAAGTLLGSLLHNDSQAAGAGVGLGLVLAALGGSMMPLEVFPEGMQRVALLTPHGWANTAMAEIVRRDGGVADIAIELGVLAGASAVLLAVATWLLRRALTR